MSRKERPTEILGGYKLDRNLMPIRQCIDTSRVGDYGADPIEGGAMFKMVPSGDVVDWAERCRRLGGKV